MAAKKSDATSSSEKPKAAKKAAKKSAVKSPSRKSAAKKVPAKRASKSTPKSSSAGANSVTPYERNEIKEIKTWKEKEPTVMDRTMGFAVEPVAWMIRKVVPEEAIMKALQTARKISARTVNTGDVLRDGGVTEIAELRTKGIELSDRLADNVHNWAIGMAAAEGAGTGVFGIFGAPIDVPALITLALRTIEKIGVCYGYECKTKEDEDFILHILAAAGANNVEEKFGALIGIRAIQNTLLKQSWTQIAMNAAKNQASREGVVLGLRALAKQLSINITKRKALAAIPYVGALIGGSMNAWYIRDIGWAARRVFQERWLIENRKLIDV